MARKEISGAEALKAFKTRPTVQVAKAGKIKGADGKERKGFITSKVPCAPEHIIGAADYGDRVTIVTINGERHEARA